MPRKAAVSAADSGAEPRRSSRIKDLPKAEPAVKKTAAKPRGKKAKAAEAEPPAEGEEATQEEPVAEKPKSSKGKKRTTSDRDAEEAAAEGANGAETAKDEGDKPPPSKRVCHDPHAV